MEYNFKHTELPKFVSRDGVSLIFNQDGQLIYYVPDAFFNGKRALLEGETVVLLGSFCYRLVSKSGSLGELKQFNYPSMFICKPSSIEKVKDYKLTEVSQAKDYRLLIFEKGDQLVTNVFTPQDLAYTEELLSLHILTGKIPENIPYIDLYKYPYKSMQINGEAFQIHTQLMALLYSKICRDPKDLKKVFRLSKELDIDNTSYIPISIKDVPKYSSPYTSITSENIDEGILSSVLLSQDEDNGKPHVYSPLEKVLTM